MAGFLNIVDYTERILNVTILAFTAPAVDLATTLDQFFPGTFQILYK
jgi:hypothetical protein